MDAKISFGIDYLYMMTTANLKSGSGFDLRAYALSIFLLLWDWGFTFSEEEDANTRFCEMIDKESLEESTVVAIRIIDHLKNNDEAKTKFIINMMMVNMIDGNISSEEAILTEAFVKELDFRNSEISEMRQKAKNRVVALVGYVENLERYVENNEE